MSASGVIEFRLLGAVDALDEGAALPLGGPRQRALLALLLLARGQPISSDRLADELWHGEPPDGATTTLRSYVSRLRSALGSDAFVKRSAAGYALNVRPDLIDAFLFERLTREGQEALSRGAVRRAAERLREAVSLWRGRPFGELGDEGTLRIEAERLEELRLHALEQLTEAELALGRSAELVDDIEKLVAEHPHRERLWRQLMLALYRAGRQADALAAYHRARTLLDEQLGLEPSEDLQQLELAILRHEVTPVVPPEQRHNLPAQLTSFVGRDVELAEVIALVADSRLVTLTGVGGVGKTRLGLEAAARGLPDFPGGAWFVDLASLTDPALVARHAAAVLDIREQPGRPIEAVLAERLRDVELLLVLDNCEHLRQAAAELAHNLLAAAPPVRILATSREVLGAPGEVAYAVPPLATPAAGADSKELRASESVRLFLARAHAARPRFAESEAALATMGRICRELEGLPLALELAAARLNALSVDDISARITDRFRFLVSWRRLTPARHRTLREAIAWSYDLLTPAEQGLLARLSVFAGGFSLEAAAKVSLPDDENRAPELLGRLIDASLVIAEERGREMRYRLLETIRQYAAEQLDSMEEAAATSRRHAGYFLGLAEEGLIGIRGAEQSAWLALFESEHDNFRAALTTMRDGDRRDQLLRLARALWFFWWVHGHWGEGRRWLDRALERSADLDPDIRAGALNGAAGLAWAQADLARAGDLAQAALDISVGLGDRVAEYSALNVLGHVALARHQFQPSEALFERCRAIAVDSREVTDHALAMHNLGSVALGQKELERAETRYEKALGLYRAAVHQQGIALSQLYLAIVTIEMGRHEEAGTLLADALRSFRELGFVQYSGQCLEGIAAIIDRRGDSAGAVRLLASASALRDRTGNAPTVAARLRDRLLADLREDLDDAAFAAAWAEGQSVSEADALDRAERALEG